MSGTAQIALCRLIEQNNHWLPIGWTTELNASHRSTPEGPILHAQIYADVSGGEIVGWRRACFSAYDVKTDGSIDYHLKDVPLILGADKNDKAAVEAGAIGISRKILKQRQEREQSRISNEQRAAAYERAIIQIKDRLAGQKVKGVTLINAE